MSILVLSFLFLKENENENPLKLMTRHFTREEVCQEALATKTINEWSVWGRWAMREGSDGNLFVGMLTAWLIR